MEYKYLVIEDNPQAAQTLSLLMEDFPQFKMIDITHDLKTGIKLVLNHKPDLIFLDVELPTFTGFEFIQELRKHLQVLPAIIMSTAHDKYALSAVNENVLHYLLKPVDPDELMIALNKFKNLHVDAAKQLTIKNQKGYSFLNFDDILLLESSSNYTNFYTTNLEKITISKTMKEYESQLSKAFLRIHKSFIVNTQYIKFLNTTKKRLILQIPDHMMLKNTKGISFTIDMLDDRTIEIPIGESYLDIVRNSILYNKIG